MKTLRFWILLLISVTMVCMLGIGLISAYFVIKNNLVNDSQIVNKEYSESVAQNTEKLFDRMLSTLTIVAEQIPHTMHDPTLVEERLKRLLISGNHFNSMSVVNSDGVVIATSPDVGITGAKLKSTGTLEALANRIPTVSSPYTATTGRLIILVSAPLWSEEHEYLGFIAGTIYLQEENSLQEVIGTHFANNGSYIWVVDEKGNLIYHPSEERVGDPVKNNPITQKVLRGESGSQRVTNTLDQDFLASYTYLPTSRWGIVSQTPYEVVVNPVGGIILKMFWLAIPLILITMGLAVYVANKIVFPIRDLAFFSQQLREHGLTKRPIIPTWYYEVKQLDETIHAYALEQKIKLDRFEETSLTDTLTGLKNRRFMEDIKRKWLETEQEFSVIMIDIDKFKLVNDTYGHQVGDEVLQFLSRLMIDTIASEGFPLRIGGEEFLILLPDKDLEKATSIAETLRQRLEVTDSPTGRPINISVGVGEYSKGENYSDFLNRIDLALYVAKSNGRNRVEQSINK
ncbi:sensor domain-containing diguanylate cyclase [Paenisporosarcina indica]|uniref:sensor domain-containing diguanylate cyclase n=1 Tax=Paenisporosarcina indica TaxID=650093 RepID=UPI00094F5F34|nr:sensor domain-containing diguanylate cyclase [Paenisporosarcina indica]